MKAFAGEYQRAGKKGKGEILNRFVAATGYHRRYAARLLRLHGRTIWIGPGVGLRAEVGAPVRRSRKRIYDEAVQEVLKRLWRMLDYLCGKRLQAALPEVVAALERHGELRLPQEVREKLLRMGAATIDRLLAGEKKKLQLKSRSRTKAGTLLRQQIPVRTFADWDEVRPGFAEIDLVGHDGGSTRGDYVQTLNLTDVATTWAEAAAVRNRARVWVLEALEQLRQQLPFPLLGLDSDYGGEFINGHLLEYCTREELTFTRSRPWRKNDNCFVEQKNYSVVRPYVGYARYDSEAELQLLNRLYAELRLYVNFFLPSHKLQRRSGGEAGSPSAMTGRRHRTSECWRIASS